MMLLMQAYREKVEEEYVFLYPHVGDRLRGILVSLLSINKICEYTTENYRPFFSKKEIPFWSASR